MTIVQKIDSFRGKYFFLSNFFPVPVMYKGLTYQNNEAAFQAQKTFSPELKTTFTTLAPSDAKRKGRHVRLRQDWEQVKDRIMEEIVRAKFIQNPKIKEQLLSTGDAILIEGNTWNDCYWGVDARSGIGENHLGKILMKIRSELSEAK